MLDILCASIAEALSMICFQSCSYECRSARKYLLSPREDAVDDETI